MADTQRINKRLRSLEANASVTSLPAVIVAAASADAVMKANAHYVCDGVADDVEINAAIQDNTGPVRLSVGEFSIADTIDINKDNTHLEGANWNRTVLKAVDNLNKDIIGNSLTQNRFFCHLRHLQIDGNKANNATGHALNIEFCHTNTYEFLFIKDAAQMGIRLSGDATRNALNNTLFRLRVQACQEDCIRIGNNAPNNHVLQNILSGTVAGNVAVLSVQNAEANIIGNHIHTGAQHGVLLSSNNANFVGNYIESCQQHGLRVTGTGHNIQANNIFNNGVGGSGSGISLAGDRNRIIGNRSYDKSGAGGTQEYGIDIDAGALSDYVVYNDFAGNKTGGINGTGGAGTVITPNITA